MSWPKIGTSWQRYELTRVRDDQLPSSKVLHRIIKEWYQYIKILCKLIIKIISCKSAIKIISKICSWHLYWHWFGHFMTLISETHNQVCQLPVTTSGKKKNRRKLVRVITAESIYRCMLPYLDHILYRKAHFVRGALHKSRAVVAITDSTINSKYTVIPLDHFVNVYLNLLLHSCVKKM